MHYFFNHLPLICCHEYWCDVCVRDKAYEIVITKMTNPIQSFSFPPIKIMRGFVCIIKIKKIAPFITTNKNKTKILYRVCFLFGLLSGHQAGFAAPLLRGFGASRIERKQSNAYDGHSLVASLALNFGTRHVVVHFSVADCAPPGS